MRKTSHRVRNRQRAAIHAARRQEPERRPAPRNDSAELVRWARRSGNFTPALAIALFPYAAADRLLSKW